MVAKAVCRWCRRTALVVVAMEPVAGCSGCVRLVALGVRWLLVGVARAWRANTPQDKLDQAPVQVGEPIPRKTHFSSQTPGQATTRPQGRHDQRPREGMGWRKLVCDGTRLLSLLSWKGAASWDSKQSLMVGPSFHPKLACEDGLDTYFFKSIEATV